MHFVPRKILLDLLLGRPYSGRNLWSEMGGKVLESVLSFTSLLGSGGHYPRSVCKAANFENSSRISAPKRNTMYLEFQIRVQICQEEMRANFNISDRQRGGNFFWLLCAFSRKIGHCKTIAFSESTLSPKS